MIVCLTAYGKTVEERVADAYHRQQTVGYSSCIHKDIKFQKTQFNVGQSIVTDFLLAGEPVQIIIKEESRDVVAKMIGFGGKFLIEGEFKHSSWRKFDRYKHKNITWNFKKLNSFTSKKVRKLGLMAMSCRVNAHRDLPTVLTQKKVHINMHPHSIYDPNGITLNTAQKYLDDPSFQQIVYIENRDLTYHSDLDDFLKESAKGAQIANVSLPLVDIPENAEVISASAGHALYKIEVSNLDVYYTGGNSNYCILNNVKRLIDRFIQHNESGNLTINFDMDGIVGQDYTWLKGTAFIGPYKQGYFLRDYFNLNPGFENTYHAAYKAEFTTNHFNMYHKNPLFRTIDFIYDDGRSASTTRINGTGSGHFTINMKYIHR